MAGFIVKQPNGLHCRYSTVVDCPTHWNMTFDDYVLILIDRLNYTEQKAREEAKDVIDNYLRDFSEILERFTPNNMTRTQFKVALKEMGYDFHSGNTVMEKTHDNIN